MVTVSALIKPICLPVTGSIRRKNWQGSFPFVVGWGSLFWTGPSEPQLQQIQMPIVPQEKCRKTYNTYKGVVIDDRVVCAGFTTGGRDACQGDSGGPLMYPIGDTFYAIGVVAYGVRCAQAGFPSVFTNTTTFLDFIIPLLN